MLVLSPVGSSIQSENVHQLWVVELGCRMHPSSVLVFTFRIRSDVAIRENLLESNAGLTLLSQVESTRDVLKYAVSVPKFAVNWSAKILGHIWGRRQHVRAHFEYE